MAVTIRRLPLRHTNYMNSRYSLSFFEKMSKTIVLCCCYNLVSACWILPYRNVGQLLVNILNSISVYSFMQNEYRRQEMKLVYIYILWHRTKKEKSGFENERKMNAQKRKTIVNEMEKTIWKLNEGKKTRRHSRWILKMRSCLTIGFYPSVSKW